MTIFGCRHDCMLVCWLTDTNKYLLYILSRILVLQSATIYSAFDEWHRSSRTARFKRDFRERCVKMTLVEEHVPSAYVLVQVRITCLASRFEAGELSIQTDAAGRHLLIRVSLSFHPQDSHERYSSRRRSTRTPSARRSSNGRN